MTRVSRWVGLLEVAGDPFEDDTPIFTADADPFTVRFLVKPLIWLSAEEGVPIKHPDVWKLLEMTKDLDPRTPTWTGKVRSSLAPISDADGATLEGLLRRRYEQSLAPFPLTDDERKKLKHHVVQRADGPVNVALPMDSDDSPDEPPTVAVVRESIKVQALLARIGAAMGLKIWIPRNDRSAVYQEWKPEPGVLVDTLPVNYDDITVQTIERIDVLWLKRRSIVRAFEVEHTTAIYSGILRMADLLALQPNMDIKLHLVAPVERREKVMHELRRPVFSLLERMPLAKACTFIDYDSVHELAASPHLEHLASTVVDDYAETAD